ncbi:MAG: hypothetical protein GY788_13525 [bacterium]|nr:hypothetical protein [bacterium]
MLSQDRIADLRLPRRLSDPRAFLGVLLATTMLLAVAPSAPAHASPTPQRAPDSPFDTVDLYGDGSVIRHTAPGQVFSVDLEPANGRLTLVPTATPTLFNGGTVFDPWKPGDVHVHAAGDSSLDSHQRCPGIDSWEQCAHKVVQETVERADHAGLDWLIYVEHAPWLGLKTFDVCHYVPLPPPGSIRCGPVWADYDEGQAEEQWNYIREAANDIGAFEGIRTLMGEEMGTAFGVPCSPFNPGHFSAYELENIVHNTAFDCRPIDYIERLKTEQAGWGSINHPDAEDGGSPWKCWFDDDSGHCSDSGNSSAADFGDWRGNDPEAAFRAIEIVSGSHLPSEKALDDWDRLLLNDFRVAATGGSDSHTSRMDAKKPWGPRTPGNDAKIGLTGRTYAYAPGNLRPPVAGHNSTDREDPVRLAIQEGMTVATNGPLAVATVNDALPGETALIDDGGNFVVRIDWEDEFDVLGGDDVIDPTEPAEIETVGADPERIVITWGPQLADIDGIRGEANPEVTTNQSSLVKSQRISTSSSGEFELTQADLDANSKTVALQLDNTAQDAWVRVDVLYELENDEEGRYLDDRLYRYGAFVSPIYLQPTAIQDLEACGPSSGFDNTMFRNDDNSVGPVALGFDANFFGTTYESVFVNTNGNLTFQGALGKYSPVKIDEDLPPIIAPFFADVDTRGFESGLVHYAQTEYFPEFSPDGIGRPAFCVMWGGFTGVGHYAQRDDLRNRFQVVLVDRSDRSPGDFDIVFNYADIQWETGDADGGTDELPVGFGGNSAAIGYSAGDGNPDHFYEHPGSQVPGSFPHPGPEGEFNGSALVFSGARSMTRGRYVYQVINGEPPAGATEVDGTVTRESDGTALTGAPVQICSASEPGCVFYGLTNESGHFDARGLPPGTYDITAYPPAGELLIAETVTAVTVAADQVETVDLALTGAAAPPPGTEITSIGYGSDDQPVIYWQDPLFLRTKGCEGGVGAYEIAMSDGTIVRSGPMTETEPGLYEAGPIAPLHPVHGDAVVSMDISDCGSGESTSVVFGIYIDPSGAVLTTTGDPIPGAKVTLLRSDSDIGPFHTVPPGSAVMSPMNRRNPDFTDDRGLFGWDVVTGYYRVRAEMAGCHAPGDPGARYVETQVYLIPPPVLDIDLRLECPFMPSSASVEIDSVSPTDVYETDPEVTATWHADRQGDYYVQTGSRDCHGGRTLTGGQYATIGTPEVTTIDAAELNAGDNQLHICLVDTNRVVSQATTTVTRHADRVPPLLTALQSGSDSGASDSDRITAAESLTFEGVVESGATVTLIRDGIPIVDVLSVDGSFVVTDPGPVPQGELRYSASAIYADGANSTFVSGLNVTADRLPPETVLNVTETPSEVNLSFSAVDEDAQFECSYEGNPFTPCVSPEVVPPTAHVDFEVRAIDIAGNVDPTPELHSIGGVPCTITGTAGDDILSGTSGNDVICGLGGNDTLKGKGGDDILIGGAGDDTLKGGQGHDTLEGGDGDDQLKGEQGDDTLLGEVGDDLLEGGYGEDILTDEAGNDTLRGNQHDDTLDAGEGNNVVEGGYGDDVITTGDGDDTIEGNQGADVLLAGSGSNTVKGGYGDDVIITGSGADTIEGNQGRDDITSGDGNDNIDGGYGDDVVSAGDGDDTVEASLGADQVSGGLGDDTIDGGSGDDSLDGGDGQDQLFGGSGADVLQGGSGNDFLDGESGVDHLDGGDGFDACASAESEENCED